MEITFEIERSIYSGCTYIYAYVDGDAMTPWQVPTGMTIAQAKAHLKSLIIQSRQ